MGPSDNNLPPLEPDRLLTQDRPTYQIPSRPTLPSQPLRPPVSAIIRILGGSVFVALLLVVGLVQFYGRNERLATVEKVLIKPEVLTALSFSDTDPVNKRKNVFFFENISFLPAGDESALTVNIPTEKYEDLYEAIAKDPSIRIVTEDLEERFQDPLNVHTLTIYVSTQVKAGQAKDQVIFQTVQFLVASPFYRVAMRQAGGQHWVYFRHTQNLDALVEQLKAK